MSAMGSGYRCLDKNIVELITNAAKEDLLPLSKDMVEKDILVADAVRTVCEAGKSRGAQIIFAGGTSLSQAHQVISRMSEDADFRIVLPPDATSQNQRRNFLSAIKTDIVQAMEQSGFLLDGDLKARNSNAYIMGNFAYTSAFVQPESLCATSLRPLIKLEITAFAPVSQVVDLPLRTILDRMLDRASDPSLPAVPVVSIEDTLADKVVGYLRRTAADRAGCGRGDYDDRLVRHLYDVHCVLQKKGEISEIVAPLFVQTVERDKDTYGNQFPAFKKDPFGILQDEREHLYDDVTKDRYERFCRAMIYGNIPSFQEVADTFYAFSGKLLAMAREVYPEQVSNEEAEHIRKEGSGFSQTMSTFRREDRI